MTLRDDLRTLAEADQKKIKRWTIRDDLRARCAVFNETDSGSENAPEGWVEIQRNDTIDVGCDLETFESDEHAALAVAETGGARGTAMHYECGGGIWEPVALDGLGTSQARWVSLNYAARATDPETRFRASPSLLSDAHAHAEGTHWICIVPRHVAIAAGLDCREEPAK